MVALGVDIGSEFVKAVILNQEHILASAAFQSSDDTDTAAQKVVNQVLKNASMALEDLSNIAATGSGRKDIISIKRNFSDPICHARGAAWLFPHARTILAMGAHSSIAVKIGKDGKVKTFITSDKCAGGSGSFLVAMAKVLNTPLDEFSVVPRSDSREKVKITNFCAVFAESEVISLIHNRISKADIIAGIIDTVSDKCAQLLKQIGVEEDVVLTGGVAKANTLTKSLEEKLRIPVHVPEDPMITGAIGAALLGAERG